MLSFLHTTNIWNANVDVYSLKSLWVQQTIQFTPLVLELSLIHSHLLWGEFSTFSTTNASHNFPIFHSTRYPLLLGGLRQYGMRILPDTSTHDQEWESNPTPSDLKSNALSTWPRAPITTTGVTHYTFTSTLTRQNKISQSNTSLHP